MASLHLTPTTIRVEFTVAEHISGLLRDLELPRSAVTRVSLEDDPLPAARGLRAPGLALPGMCKVGTWRGRRRRAIVSVRRGMPAVRIVFEGAKVDETLLSLTDAAAVVAQLRD